MGETSVYFVPDDQDRWFGRERDIAEAFWDIGIFLATSDDFIYDRIEDWKAKGKRLPNWTHSFTFADMGVASSDVEDLVPSSYLEVHCPACDADLSEVANVIWEDEDSTVPRSHRAIKCRSCKRSLAGDSLHSPETPYTFARVYLWVSDIEDDWDETFLATVERVLGPCKQFRAWST